MKLCTHVAVTCLVLQLVVKLTYRKKRTMAVSGRPQPSTNVRGEIALLFGLFTGIAALMFGWSGLCTTLAILGGFHVWRYYNNQPHNPEKESITGCLDASIRYVLLTVYPGG